MNICDISTTKLKKIYYLLGSKLLICELETMHSFWNPLTFLKLFAKFSESHLWFPTLVGQQYHPEQGYSRVRPMDLGPSVNYQPDKRSTEIQSKFSLQILPISRGNMPVP